MITPLRRALNRLLRSRLGSSAVEFVGMAPVVGVLLFASVDLGNVLYTKFRLNAAVAAGGNYVLSRTADISTASATNVAETTATIVANTTASGFATTIVTVNNGPVTTVTGGTPATTSPATQDIPIKQGRCYCPTSASTFGANAACGAACGGGGIAGRFVTISAKRAYTPLLSSYGATSGGYIIVSNVVQTE